MYFLSGWKQFLPLFPLVYLFKTDIIFVHLIEPSLDMEKSVIFNEYWKL